jgi:DNA-binding response OmpR family regulator
MTESPAPLLLLIEDNPSLAATLVVGLREAGYQVELATSAGQACAWLEKQVPDLVLLDLGLPDADGTSLLPALRSRQPAPGVLITTARDTETDRVSGLDAGADDYLTKPFSFAELLARLRALRRRRESSGQEPTELRVGALQLNLLARTAHCSGSLLDLSPREFDLLACLARQAGSPVSRETLARDVWKNPRRFTPLDNLMEVHLSRLRQNLAEADEAPRIVTVRGVGYQLERNP